MELSVEQFPAILARSRLFSQDEARSLTQRWFDESSGGSKDFGLFLKWLVTNQHLTEYQANLLHRGHNEGFFLNEYKILERLGRGRMAGVYKAVHRLGQVVAIKVLPPSKARDPELWARFQREARLALRLKHANVVRAYQMGEARGCHYLVMEHLVGETLEEVLQRRARLPPAEAVRLVRQALLGLQHLHDQGLVHRDLKPANLMLVPPLQSGQPDTTLKATVKILDIGLGRILYDENAPEKAEDAKLTGTGVVLGTPQYMAPEQARDARAADIRADIYSLGCVLYHALTGQPPFPDTNLLRQMIRHATETPRPLTEFTPGVPDGLQQVLDWMLAKEPAQRYPTPERAAQALQILLAVETELPSPTETGDQLRTYLKWLDSEGPAETPDVPLVSPALKGRPMPVAVPVATPPAEQKPHQSTMPPGHKRRRTEKKAARAIRTVPVTPTPRAEAAETFDVELVPVTAPSPSNRHKRFELSRRDLLMMGIGATGVSGLLTTIYLGYWLASRLGGREPTKHEEASPSSLPKKDKDRDE